MPGRPLVHRRTALAGLAATVLVAGCDNGDEIAPPSATGSPSSTTAGPSPSAAEQTPDEALVDATVEQLRAAFGLLVVARTLPPLRPVVVPLIRAHRRHVEVLEGDLQGGASPVLTDPAQALRAVRRSERALHATLVDAAGRAQSGALAALLASMSASVTQHLALLPPEVAS